MTSKRTKQCRRRKIIFSILHFLCVFGPFIYFIPYGYITGEIGNKVVMSFSVVTCLILTVISVITDIKHRAGLHRIILWGLITGVLFCLNEVKTFIYIMAVTSIIDELVFVKLKDYYKTAEISNKEMDRRYYDERRNEKEHRES